MKYYLVKLLTNTQGQDGSSIAVFDSKDKALVAYHQNLAAYHNAEDVLYHGSCGPQATARAYTRAGAGNNRGRRVS